MQGLVDKIATLELAIALARGINLSNEQKLLDRQDLVTQKDSLTLQVGTLNGDIERLKN